MFVLYLKLEELADLIDYKHSKRLYYGRHYFNLISISQSYFEKIKKNQLFIKKPCAVIYVYVIFQLYETWIESVTWFTVQRLNQMDPESNNTNSVEHNRQNGCSGANATGLLIHQSCAQKWLKHYHFCSTACYYFAILGILLQLGFLFIPH